MKITSDILYDILKEKYDISRYGRRLRGHGLPLPVFYTETTDLTAGAFYILRTQDLPSQPRAECLFLCVGTAPANIPGSWPGEVFYLSGQTLDLLTVFNTVQSVFNRITQWTCKMQSLVEANAGMEELVKTSIPIFENRITVTDYDLRVLAYCEAQDIAGGREVQISRKYDRVPNKKSVLFENIHHNSVLYKEPFVYPENVDGRVVDQYCINLFLDDTYMGCCSLCEDLRPLRESDYVLFQQFASYIRRALYQQSRTPASQFSTIKTLLADLLHCFPVSRSALNRALESFERNMGIKNPAKGRWYCLVVQSANKGKTLPDQYLCKSLEDMLPSCAALPQDGVIAAFCFLTGTEKPEDEIVEILSPYLQDMNFRAGLSAPFQDIYKAYSYFVQARSFLVIGCEQDPSRFLYPFPEYVLRYMLQHCCGEFEPAMVLSPGLMQLRNCNDSVDYWGTLRRYLDCECNASRTAQEMFLHRSTLQPRLEKIKSLVKLDTPEQRLYLRICLYLWDRFGEKKRSK